MTNAKRLVYLVLEVSKLFFRKFFGLKDLPDPKCFDDLNNGINS